MDELAKASRVSESRTSLSLEQDLEESKSAQEANDALQPSHAAGSTSCHLTLRSASAEVAAFVPFQREMRQVDTSHLHKDTRLRIRPRMQGISFPPDAGMAFSLLMRASCELGSILVVRCFVRYPKPTVLKKLWMRHLEDPKVALCDPAKLVGKADSYWRTRILHVELLTAGGKQLRVCGANCHTGHLD